MIIINSFIINTVNICFYYFYYYCCYSYNNFYLYHHCYFHYYHHKIYSYPYYYSQSLTFTIFSLLPSTCFHYLFTKHFLFQYLLTPSQQTTRPHIFLRNLGISPIKILPIYLIFHCEGVLEIEFFSGFLDGSDLVFLDLSLVFCFLS